MLSGANKFKNKKDFIELLETCINFTFRYSTICNFHNNKLERKYSEIAIKIRHGKIQTIKQIKEELKDKEYYPDNKIFLTLFKEKEIRNNKLAKYVLKKINDKFTKGELESRRNITVEHIIPKV